MGEGIDRLFAKLLEGQGWVETAARALIQTAIEYTESGTVKPGPLDICPLPDPLEAYCRAEAASAPVSVQMELLYPSALVHAGAAGQGGWWAVWEGRGKPQAVPLIDHHIGLAGSGMGKSTTQNVSGALLRAGIEAGIEEVSRGLAEMAYILHGSVDTVLSEWKKDLDIHPNPHENDELKIVRDILIRAVTSVTTTATKRVRDSGGGTNLSDATMEALVGLASDIGGAVMLRAGEQDVLDNLTRYSVSGQSGSLSPLTQGWDGDPYTRIRQGSGSQDVASLVMSVSLMTQSESFAKAFNGPAGAALLEKGVLGRMWLTRGPDIDESAAVDQTLAQFEDWDNGIDPEGLEAAHLVKAFSRIAVEGARTRVVRVVEGRILSAAMADRGVANLDQRGNYELKKAAAALELLTGRAVSAYSIVRDSGAGALVGRVLRVSDASAKHLSALFVLCKLLADDDPVLTPCLTRYVSHVVRDAGIRNMVAVAALGSEQEWQAWLQAGVIGDEWVEDTAVRVCYWWMRQHLGVVAGIRAETVAAQARESAMKEARFPDASLEGLAAQKLVQNAVVLPMPARELAHKLAGYGGLIPENNRSLREKAWKDMFEGLIAKPGNGWFIVTKKASGGRPVSWVEPGGKYTDAMHDAAASGKGYGYG